MRVLVAGLSGQLGHGLVSASAGTRLELVPVARRIGRRDPAQRLSRLFGEASPPARSTLEGDVTATRWGIDDQTLDELAGSVDAVVNLAAETNWAAPFSRLLRTNVVGAMRGIEVCDALARDRRIPTYVYASSIHAAGGREGWIAEDPLGADRRRTPYEQSKWRAEQALLDAARRPNAPPTAIARIGGLVGDSRTGETVRRNSLYLLAGEDSLPWGLLPLAHRGRVDMLPRDVAGDLLARYVLSLYDRRPAAPEIVHLCAGEQAPTTLSFLAAARAVDAMGTVKVPRPLPVPSRSVTWLSEHVDRGQALSASRRNLLIGLRYLSFDRIFERSRLMDRVGSARTAVSVEELAALAFGVKRLETAGTRSDDPVSLGRFAG